MLADNYFSPKKRRFQYRTTFFAGLFILAITVVLSYTAGRIFEETLQQEAGEAMLKLAHEAASTIEHQIASRKTALEGIASDCIIEGKYGDRNATFDQKIDRLNQEYERVKGLGFLKLGIIQKDNINTYQTGERIDVSDMAYVKSVWQNHRTMVTSTLSGKSKDDLVIVFATPIYEYGTDNMVAILTGVIDAKQFSDAISAISYKVSGHGIAVDNTGKTIAHKEYDRVLSQENVLKNPEHFSIPLRTIVMKMAKGEEGVGEYTFEGVDKFIAYAPVKSAMYSIAINAKKDEVFAKAKEGKQTLYTISAAIFIFSLVLVYFISDRIEKERIRLRKEKRHHKKWLKNIVETSPLGIIFTDKNGIIEYVNPKYTEMTGYALSEVIGEKPSILKSGVQNRDFYQKLWDTITSGKMWHGEVANQKKNGDIYWEEMYIVPIADERGEIGSFVASKIDITERKWLFNELVQANCELNELTEKLTEREENLKKINDHLTELVQEESANIIHKEKLLFQQSKMAAMGEMIGMIAHQWRQPLNAVSAAAIKINMLNELGSLSKGQLLDTMNFIQEMTQKMSATINDFMDFSRPNREKEFVSIQKVFESAITIIQPQLETRNITLKLDLEEDIKLYVYKKELAHIMLNLLANARDAFENKEIAEKNITIKAYQENEHTIIEVSDNAGGIELSIIDKIFDPFFTTKPTEKGTGLGLYMSKMMIIEHMNGEITASTVGSNALFRISIPY